MSKSLAFWTLGVQFLNLAREGCGEIEKARNPFVVISRSPMSTEQIDQATRWSDTSVGTPLLFNYFHGIELILKGFLAAKGCSVRTHKLSELLTSVEKLYPCSKLGQLVKSVLENAEESPFKTFLSNNKLSIDSWFEALKYPETTQGVSVSHTDLKYGGKNAATFWSGIKTSCESLRRQAEELSQSCGNA